MKSWFHRSPSEADRRHVLHSGFGMWGGSCPFLGFHDYFIRIGVEGRLHDVAMARKPADFEVNTDLARSKNTDVERSTRVSWELAPRKKKGLLFRVSLHCHCGGKHLRQLTTNLQSTVIRTCINYHGAGEFQDTWTRLQVLSECWPDKCILTCITIAGFQTHCLIYNRLRKTKWSADRTESIVVFRGTNEGNGAGWHLILQRLVGKNAPTRCKIGIAEWGFPSFIDWNGCKPDPSRFR